MISTPYLPFYIKKEDAKDVLRGQKILLSLLPLSMAIIIGSARFFIFPKLMETFADFATIPKFPLTDFFTNYAYYLSAALVFISIYLLTTDKFDAEFNEILAKYKDTDLIKTSKLQIKYQWLMLILVGLCLGLLVTAVILPINYMTGTI